MKILLTAVLMSLSLCATAQTTATEEPAKKPVAKKVEPRKGDPKKTAPPKKVVAKKPAEPKKVTVYKNDPNAPVIRDTQGNAIPTNPEAYDVSSAVGKK